MPSDQSYWLVSAPWKNGDEDDLFRSIKTVVSDNTATGVLELPSLKVGHGHLAMRKAVEGELMIALPSLAFTL